MLNFLLKKFSSNLAYARAFTKNQKCLFLVTLVIGIHNCLTLSKKFTFYIVYNTFTLLQKLKTFLQLEISERSVTRGPDGKIWTAGARAISQLKDSGFRTAEKMERKIKFVIEQFVVGQFAIGQFSKSITFKVVV